MLSLPRPRRSIVTPPSVTDGQPGSSSVESNEAFAAATTYTAGSFDASCLSP